MDLPNRVRIYEVGPRDGLQNETTPLPTATKRRFIELLVAAGLREIEATSFVSPRAIPQLADADVLLPSLPRKGGSGGRSEAGSESRADAGSESGSESGSGGRSEAGSESRAAEVRYPVLVPNERGLARAEAAGAKAIAVFTAASDAFTQHNIGQSVAESLETFAPVLATAKEHGWWTRGYVSTAFGCPYTGRVEPARVVEVARALRDLGLDEVCLGDTIGVGVPSQVHELTAALMGAGLPLERLAYHFHDTRGTALANVVAGLEDGVTCFDSSTGGTGGCPYAPGAAGNLATEDLVYLLDGLGIDHGAQLPGVLEAARFIAAALGRPLASKVGQAGGWDPTTGAATGRS